MWYDIFHPPTTKPLHLPYNNIIFPHLKRSIRTLHVLLQYNVPLLRSQKLLKGGGRMSLGYSQTSINRFPDGGTTYLTSENFPISMSTTHWKHAWPMQKQQIPTVDGRNFAPPKYVKILNWSETSQIASEFDEKWSRLKECSRRSWIWHSRRNLRNGA
jgi:hypothetical protein